MWCVLSKKNFYNRISRTHNIKQTPFLAFLIAQFSGGILGATIANGMFEVDGVFEGTCDQFSSVLLSLISLFHTTRRSLEHQHTQKNYKNLSRTKSLEHQYTQNNYKNLSRTSCSNTSARTPNHSNTSTLKQFNYALEHI